MNTHEVKLNWDKGLSFSGMVNNHELRIDADSEVGGEDLGMRPKPLMLAALAGCTGIDVVSILNKMRVQYSDFSVAVKAPLTEEHPKVYNNFSVVYTIKVMENEKDKVEKAVKLSEERYCGVSAMLRNIGPVTSEIVFL